jgi:hypothetical protein
MIHIGHRLVTSKLPAITNHYISVIFIHSQEITHPVGILAVTSTFPYLILAFPLVLILALITGLIIVPKLELLTAPH